jgi:rhodanese-related sulfurtransferase
MLMKFFRFSESNRFCTFVKFKPKIMMTAQLKHYEAKLAFEIDPSDLFEAMNNGERIVPVDARRPYAFGKEHIPGAINIPHRTMNAENTKTLRKDVLYVTYCDGIGCNASTKGALKLVSLGFNVKELIGGIEWWKLDGYNTEGSHGMFGAKVRCVC